MASGEIRCTNCQRSYPEEGLPYICPWCEGIFDYSSPWILHPGEVDDSQPGIWKYRSTFGLDDNLIPISLQEGNTSLVWRTVYHRNVAFKCEYENPTGSFKDRGSTVLAGWLLARGMTEVVEDSSGNAGASLAAYAAKGRIKARIFVPASTDKTKQQRIREAGAELVPIQGTRAETGEAVRREAGKGMVYASHAYLPFNLPGYATCAYEIFHQLGNKMPGTVLVPVGQGGLYLGLKRGFTALRIAKEIQEPHIKMKNKVTPMVVGVQARACAPLWMRYHSDPDGLKQVTEGETLAEGVKILHPVREDTIMREMENATPALESVQVPRMCAVDEGEIQEGQLRLAGLGFQVEPTAALVWGALRQCIETAPEPVVVILTGSRKKNG